MKSILIEEGLGEDVDVESAGTAGWHEGGSPDSRSVAAAAARGVTVEGRARQVERDDFDQFDMLVAMDQSNQFELINLARNEEQRAKVSLLREFDPAAVSDGDLDVPDPYYGGDDGFENVLDIVDRGCRGLLGVVRERLDS